jgi:hypothetical protein
VHFLASKPMKSEPIPTGKKRLIGPKGAKVIRLVGQMFGRFVQEASADAGNRLVMLHAGAAGKKGGKAPAGYEGAASAFYAVAKEVSGRGDAFPCGQMDLRTNDLPFPLELPEPAGVQAPPHMLC